MVSTSKLAGMKRETEKEILEILEAVGADVQPVVKTRNMKHLGELPFLRQVRDALLSMVIIVEAGDEIFEDVEEETSEEVSEDGDELLEANEIIDDEDGDLEIELADMSDEELFKYAGVLGVSYPSNIKRDTLIKKVLHHVKISES